MAKRKPPEGNELIKNVQHLTDILNDPSSTDLACALVAHAFLDNALMQLVRSFLIKDDKIASDLFNLKSPLGSFSQCRDVGYALGLYSKSAYDNLSKINDIRNTFAHSYTPIKFDDIRIKQLCSNLTPQQHLYMPGKGEIWMIKEQTDDLQEVLEKSNWKIIDMKVLTPRRQYSHISLALFTTIRVAGIAICKSERRRTPTDQWG